MREPAPETNFRQDAGLPLAMRMPDSGHVRARARRHIAAGGMHHRRIRRGVAEPFERANIGLNEATDSLIQRA